MKTQPSARDISRQTHGFYRSPGGPLYWRGRSVYHLMIDAIAIGLAIFLVLFVFGPLQGSILFN